MKTKLGKGFTLIEILVGIAIIGIMALGISRLDFNRLSDKQKLDIEVSKVSSLIEETRNNALIGRGVGTNLVTPDAWNVAIENSSSSGSIQIQYNVGGTYTDYQSYSIQKPFGILEATCKNIDSSDTDTLNSLNISLGYTGSIAGINGACGSVSKPSILDIKIGNLKFNKILRIQTLTNIIETL